MYVHETWPKYKEYLEIVFGVPYEKFSRQGLDFDMDNDTDLFQSRDIVITRACTIGYEPCVKMAREKFDEVKKNCSGEHQFLNGMGCNKLPYYLRPIVYASALRHGDEEDFDFLFKKWNMEHYLLERDSIFTGLCNTNSRTRSDLAWKTLLNNRARENILARAGTCSKRLINDTLLLDMFYEQPEYLKELTETAEGPVYHILTLVSRNLNTRKDIERFDEILKPHPQFAKYMAGARHHAIDRIGWRHRVAPYFGGNASEAVVEMRRLSLSAL
ncbi:hypothetical protein GCK72_016617 [Caenorhabditis remanei]|uniref:ERAP1-like C-terminal domain-containing protein n=1 Tax=Caenorhabditis remanei TaxID=31234 RepID=A0A6A5G5Q0_CAERE|nr:hypothetical protein GCK72_016617 [Caenorhabditis remanei]KAF1750071.1 hypothetical protein GCK72_016617 [Caenorhabditis remanei]